MNTTVLFHANCPDGHAAAFACWKVFGTEAQYLPVSYGQPCPDVPAEHNLYIVDFSYPEDTLKALLAARIGRRGRGEHVVTVLDHHASAQRDLLALQRQELPGLAICFDMEESGATLTWKWLQTRGYLPEPSHQPDVWAAVEDAMPTFFKYVRDRDLWRWKLPDSKPVSLAYWSVDKTDFLAIEQFAQDLGEAEGYHRIVTEGQAMQRYADILVHEQARRATLGVLGGYTVPIVNATTLFSEVGDYLCTTRPEIMFCAYYFDRQDGQRQWGLRGHGKVDLSVVAKQMGGGGHFSAAGFTTEAGWLPEATP